MPQLAVETFPSQIFWILVGFFAVYIFMSTVVAPDLEKTLENRAHHIGSIVKKAEELNSSAQKIEKDAFDMLERAEVDSAAAESKLIASFREQSMKEKDALYKIFAKESRSKSELVTEASEKCFNDIANDIDEVVQAAMLKINGSVMTSKGKSARRK